MDTDKAQTQPKALLLIAGATIVGGAVIGASMNAINGAISPLFYRNVMKWHDVEQIRRAILAQGIFEGLIYGILFAVVFTLVVSRVSRARCSFGFAFRHLLAIFAAVYCCWIAGGVIAMGLASLSPEFYRSTFIGVPEAPSPILGYAWVGGSIMGAMFGALLAGVIGSILFSVRWHRSHPQNAT